LVGDLNTDPDKGWADHNEDYAILLSAGLTDSHRDVNSTEGKTHKVSRTASDLSKRYDHILYSKFAGMACTQSRVVINADTFPASPAALPSDHYPVYSQFDWNYAAQVYPPANEARGTGSILREVYSGIAGDNIAALTSNASYPNSPSSSTQLSHALQTPFDSGDNYGQRVRGLITAPVSGGYTFQVAGTNNVELWLSSDESPVNKQKIAWIGGSDYTLQAQFSAANGGDAHSSPRWVISGSSQTSSAARTLTAGQRYYIEVLHKAGASGSDSLSVQWKLPDGRVEGPIPAFRLSPPAGNPPPANQAPNVNAGPDLNFNLPQGATLNGTASDDGLPNPPGALTVQWSKQSGPGTVTFANSAAAATTATFSQAGTYVLRLSASDGSLSSEDFTNVVVNNPPAGLPPPWQNADVGAVGVAGSASHSNGTFTLNGSGADIWTNVDQFHFVYRTLSGDGEIVARVASVENIGQPWSKAGVMFRETLNTDSRHAMMIITPTTVKPSSFQRRVDNGGQSVATHSSYMTSGWVKLVRSGNTITSYVSSTSSFGAPVGSQTFTNLPANMLVGIMVLSHDNSRLCQAVFDNVTVTTAAPPNQAPVIQSMTANPTSVLENEAVAFSAAAYDPEGEGITYSWDMGDGTSAQAASGFSYAYSTPGTYTVRLTVTDPQGATASQTINITVTSAAPIWRNRDIGNPTIAGNCSQNGGTFTITASGWDISGTADQFHFAYRRLSGDGTIQARVKSITQPDEWTKAGVMMRELASEPNAASSAHGMMIVTPSKRQKFQKRSLAGGDSTSSGPGANSFPSLPYWVKLERVGNLLKGYTKPDDGVSGWTQISEGTVTMGSSVYIGLAVTSHTNAATATAEFDNVTLTGNVSNAGQ
ncbi:MAG TPA: PKD domain-containing protein, partial [Planctomycetota bacterium]|nr:PKD domain-containing protein [Planctomycetota bacterium]